MATFTTVKNLLTALGVDDACPEAVEWVTTQTDTAIAFRDVKPEWRAWCITHDYTDALTDVVWGDFSGGELAQIVAAKPEHESRLNWLKLSGKEQAIVLKGQPQLKAKADFDKFTLRDYEDLIDARAEFATKIDFAEFDDDQVKRLVKKNPALSVHVPTRAKTPGRI